MRAKYVWLDEYFAYRKDGVITLRYPAWRPAMTLGRQVDMARYRFPYAAVLLQVGIWWRVLIPSNITAHECQRFVHASRVEEYAELLQQHGYTVVGIAQTGKRITAIYDRQLAWLLLPCSVDGIHRSGMKIEQLKLL